MPQWDKETDVLVLGYGNAGSNAAITAADAGAKVLILEKTAAGGGNVSVSSGGFVVPTNKEDYYKFQKALYELSRSEWDKDLLDLFLRRVSFIWATMFLRWHPEGRSVFTVMQVIKTCRVQTV